MEPHDVAVAGDAEWDVALDVHVERQNGLRWCWAAVAKGIVEYYGGPRRRQCEYATQFLRQTRSCCGEERSARCDVEYPVDLVLRHYRMDAPPALAGPVALRTIRRELERDRPVVALMRYPLSFHAIVISGVNVERARLRYSDPGDGPNPGSLDAQTFTAAYGAGGEWAYTLFTRARRDEMPAVSLLYDRVRDLGRPPNEVRRPERLRMNAPLYHADVRRLAAGDGLETAQLAAGGMSALFRDDPRNSSWLERGLERMHGDIVARLDAGYTVRMVQCMNVHLTALWFVWAGDPAAPRGDHYLVVPPAPYFVEEGREYTATELSDAARKPAQAALNSIPVFEEMEARLKREAVARPHP